MTKNEPFGLSERQRRLFFLIVPGVHLLDLSGPAQSFYEANEMGANYHIEFVAVRDRIKSAQGLVFADLKPLPELTSGDTVIVPGFLLNELDHVEREAIDWILEAYARSCRICSICVGAFFLAKAGLLNGRQCTTHWQVTRRLKDHFPKAIVQENRLFTQDGCIYTSAGEASGIDLSLSLIHDDYGAEMTGKVAREMVVFIRRDGHYHQNSPFVAYRSHINGGIHKVQDWITRHPEQDPSADQLADIACMSKRNLTRQFRLATGTTIRSYVHEVKMEIAKMLIQDASRTIENVANACGFQHARHFRRIWKQHHGMTPRAFRETLHK